VSWTLSGQREALLSDMPDMPKTECQILAEMPDGVAGAANTQSCSGEVDDGRRPKRCSLQVRAAS
jgi:hypothetical protein